MPTTYRRHQVTWWPLAIVGAVFALSVAGIVADGSNAGLWIGVLIAVGIVTADVSRLTVEVDEHAVHVAFRFGWPRRTISRQDIVAVAPVRVRWYHGWGVRKVAKGWMYNVSGFDAVALSLADGRAFWIGTDDPDGLVAALR